MEEKTKKRSPFLIVVGIAGSFICFCIGSGFATGQDILQYFCAFGPPAILGLVVAMVVYGYTTISALKVGYEHDFSNPMDIVEYYCGKAMGTFFKWAALVFYFMSASVMIAGFGAALNQYFGLPVAVGNIILGIACILTVLLGLRGLVDVLGSIGPIIVIIAVTIGATYFALHADALAAGMTAATEITNVPTMGPNWFMGGLFFATWAPMILVPFLAPVSTTARNEKQAVVGGIVGVIAVGLATLMMMLGIWCDYANVSQVMIPSLVLAEQVSPIFVAGIMFVVFFGIYGSTVPNFFVLSATFFKEHTTKYNVFTIASGVLATACTFILPFNTLLNLVFTAFGYLGIVFVVLMIVKDVRVRLAKGEKVESLMQ